MKNRSIKIYELIFYLIVGGTFFYPVVLRNKIMSAQISVINPFYIAAMILYMAFFLKKINKKKCLLYVCICLLGGIQLYSNIKAHSVFFTIAALFCLVVPLLFLGNNFLYGMESKDIRRALILFDIIMTVIAFTGIVHLISGKTLSFIMFLSGGDNSSRLWSIYGHPLFNTFLFLLFYVLNFYNNRIGKKIYPDIAYILISMIGILCTASKTGIVLLLLLFFTSFFKNIKLFIVEVFGVVVSYIAGLFDFVISRFVDSNFSLSTGRVEVYSYLAQQEYFKKYHLFWGYGTAYANNEYSKYLPWAATAFELPFLCYTLEYGYLYTILFYLITFIEPMIKLVKRKQWHLLACFIVLSLDINTFNAVTVANDYFVVFVFVLLAVDVISEKLYMNKGRE